MFVVNRLANPRTFNIVSATSVPCSVSATHVHGLLSVTHIAYLRLSSLRSHRLPSFKLVSVTSLTSTQVRFDRIASEAKMSTDEREQIIASAEDALTRLSATLGAVPNVSVPVNGDVLPRLSQILEQADADIRQLIPGLPAHEGKRRGTESTSLT